MLYEFFFAGFFLMNARLRVAVMFMGFACLLVYPCTAVCGTKEIIFLFYTVKGGGDIPVDKMDRIIIYSG